MNDIVESSWSWRWGLLISLFLLLPLGLSWTTSEEVQRHLSDEGSLVEVLSEDAHFLGFVLLTVVAFLRSPKTIYPALVLFVFGLREMDFHARFTTMSVTKMRFFVGDEVGIGEKSLGVLLYILLALLVYKLWVHYSDSFKAGLRRRDPGAILVVISFVLAVVTNGLLDGMVRRLAAVGIELQIPTYHLNLIEDNLELSMALLLLVAVVRHTFALLRSRSTPRRGGGS